MSDPDVLKQLQQAAADFQHGMVEDAERAATEAAAHLQGEHAGNAWQLVAMCARRRRDFETARQAALRAMQAHSSMGAELMLAIAEKNLGLIHEALARVERLAEQWPHEELLSIVRAGYLLHAGREEEGRRLHAEIVDAPAADGVVRALNLAWFAAVARDLPDALAHLTTAAEHAGPDRLPMVLDYVAAEVDFDWCRSAPMFQAWLGRWLT
jgi:tetratricopeptide (TPR) repeat protein